MTAAPCRAFPVYVVWATLGTDFLRDILREKLLLTKYIHRNLSGVSGVEVRGEPDFCIVLFRLIQPGTESDTTGRLQKLIDDDARVLLSTAVIDGVTWVRICTCNYKTHLNDIKFCLDVISSHVSLEDLDLWVRIYADAVVHYKNSQFHLRHILGMKYIQTVALFCKHTNLFVPFAATIVAPVAEAATVVVEQ